MDSQCFLCQRDEADYGWSFANWVKTCFKDKVLCKACERKFKRRVARKVITATEKKHNKLYKLFQQGKVYTEIQSTIKYADGSIAMYNRNDDAQR